MMYPLLHRLEHQGHLKANWRTAQTGRRRKYYQITEHGLKTLKVQYRQWEIINDALSGVWRDLSERSQWSNPDGLQAG